MKRLKFLPAVFLFIIMNACNNTSDKDVQGQQSKENDDERYNSDVEKRHEADSTATMTDDDMKHSGSATSDSVPL